MPAMANPRAEGYGEARPVMGDPLVTVDGAIRWLGCSRRTLYRLIDDGALVPVYIDRRPRFKSSSLQELIESRQGRAVRASENGGASP